LRVECDGKKLYYCHTTLFNQTEFVVWQHRGHSMNHFIVYAVNGAIIFLNIVNFFLKALAATFVFVTACG
jgi:hypothetical protein